MSLEICNREDVTSSSESFRLEERLHESSIWTATLKTSTFAILLCGLAQGWTMAAGTGTYIMPAFRQTMDWDINCYVSNGDCIQPPPIDAEIWSEPCLKCCCMLNEESDETQFTATMSALQPWMAAIGAVSVSSFLDRCGRRPTFIGFTGLMTFGGIFSLVGTRVALISGRIFTGLALGALVIGGVIILSELAPTPIRGVAASWSDFSLTCGLLLAVTANFFLGRTSWGWRVSHGGEGLIAGLSLCLCWKLPETPRWLVFMGREDEAMVIVGRLQPDLTIEQHALIVDSIRSNNSLEGSLSKRRQLILLWKGGEFWKVLTQSLIHMWQQLTGINGVLWPSLYNNFFSVDGAAINNICVYILKVCLNFLGQQTVDKTGRKRQMLTGGVLLTASQVLVAFLAYTWNYDGDPTVEFPEGSPPYIYNKAVGLTLVGASYVFMGAFSYSWANVPYIWTAEYLPTSVRSLGMGLCGFLAWTTAGTIAFVYPYLTQRMGLWTPFAMYAVFSGLGTIYSQWFVMETGCIPIESVQSQLDEWGSRHFFWKRFRQRTEQPLNMKEYRTNSS